MFIRPARQSAGGGKERRDSSYLDAAQNRSASPSEHAVMKVWNNAASNYFADNLLEQKMWIQSTLKGAKQRGEDWIDSRFIDEKHATSGCTACLPDIIVVNDDNIKPKSDAFRAKSAAAWQRVWDNEEAMKQNNFKPPANSMLKGDTYLYDEKRFMLLCLALPVFRKKQLTRRLQVVHLASALLRSHLHEPYV
jgi:hypothetical protein